MFEDLEDVSVALPYGKTGTVEIWTTRRNALTETSAKKTLETKNDFEFVGLRRTRTAKPAKVEKPPTAQKPPK